jgi:hypothetical protein
VSGRPADLAQSLDALRAQINMSLRLTTVHENGWLGGGL